ncbi:MAG: hypothetical protein ACRDQD_31785, partial [Nocardioidaceae bacterium]
MRRVLHGIWRILKPLGEVGLALVAIAALVLIGVLGGSTGQTEAALSAFLPASTVSTGALPGDQAAVPNEVSCMQSYVADPDNHMVNYPPVLGSPEHTDSLHTGVYPCATFTGSFSKPNRVFEYTSRSTYLQNNLIVFGGPTAAYLLYGGSGPPSAGSSVAKFNPATGQQIWNTPLQNVNISGQ